MSKTERIKHDGVVETVDGHRVKVRITQLSACGGCQLAGHCNASEMKVKYVDALSPTRQLAVGQPVVVSASLETAWRALLFSFILPLFLMLAVLLTTLIAGFAEEKAGASALGILLPYYIIIWACRDRLERKIAFIAEATDIN